MFDRSLVTSGFDTETVVSEEYLSYLILAQIEAGLLPMNIDIKDEEEGTDATVILHPPLDYERRYTPEPIAPLPSPVADSFRIELLADDPSPIAGLAFHPGGQRIAAAAWDGSVRVWDVDSKLDIAKSSFVPSVTCVAYMPGGAQVVAGYVDGRIRIFDPMSGIETMNLSGHGGPVFAVAVNAHGTRLASAAADATVRVWDVQSGNQLRIFAGHTGPVLSVAYSPDGTRIASGGHDGSVRVWDPETGTGTDVLTGHGRPVRSVAYNPAGTRIASGSDDRTVRLWNATSGAAVATLSGHEGAVNAVAYSPNGARIASASADKDIRIWRAQGGASTRVARGHRKRVLSLAFSADGTQLASGSEDSTIRTWQMPNGEPDALMAVPFMSLSIFVTIVDNVTGDERRELRAGLLLGFDIVADRTGRGMESNHALLLSLVRVSDLTRELLKAAEIDVEVVEQRIRAQLDRRVALGIAQGQAVQQIRMRKFVAPAQRSLGFYVDLALRSGPEPDAFHPVRGNVGLAQDFRDPGLPLAFATSPGLFPLLGPDLKFQRARETKPGSGDFRFPLHEDLFDPTTDEIGKLKGVRVGPEVIVRANPPPLVTGRLEIDFHIEYGEVFGDPDLHVRVLLRPKLHTGILEWDIDIDVRLGLLATLLHIAAGIVLTLMFAPALAWGSTLLVGSLLGVAVLKGLVAEPIVGRILQREIDDEAASAFLDALPARVPAASRRWDPFYLTRHQVCVLVEEVAIDEKGIAFEGTSIVLDKQPEPVTHVVIRDEERDAEDEVSALRYRVRDFQDIAADLQASAPGRDRMTYSHADLAGEPTLVSLTDGQIAERIAAGRLLAPIAYTPEAIYLAENKIRHLMCLSMLERSEERTRLIREFRANTANDIRASSGGDIRNAAVADLTAQLGRDPDADEIREEVDRRIEALVNQAQPDFEEHELPNLLEAAVARILRFDLVPAEFAVRQRAGVLVLPEDKEIVTRRNRDGTTTTYYRDRPDGNPADNLLALPRYISPYEPPD